MSITIITRALPNANDRSPCIGEYPVGRIHRDALVYVIGEGTSEVQKNIIARDLGFKA